MNAKELYHLYIKQGMSPKDAAKIAQEKTGTSAVTGRPITKHLRFTKEKTYYGQYGVDNAK